MPVLVAIDVDQAPGRPISVGYDLATAYDDTMIGLYVMSDDDYKTRRSSSSDVPAEFESREFTMDRAMNAAAGQAADAIDAALDAYDRGRVETRGRIGAPADEVLAVAEEIDPRYIVVGGRNRSPARQAIFGSVSQDIMRNADRPVVTLMEKGD